MEGSAARARALGSVLMFQTAVQPQPQPKARRRSTERMRNPLAQARHTVVPLHEQIACSFMLASCPRNSRYIVAIKMGRRQGARREHPAPFYTPAVRFSPRQHKNGAGRNRRATWPPAHFQRKKCSCRTQKRRAFPGYSCSSSTAFKPYQSLDGGSERRLEMLGHWSFRCSRGQKGGRSEGAGVVSVDEGFGFAECRDPIGAFWP